MDADVSMTSSRNSRWDRSPVLDGDRTPCIASLTERDIEIFKLLARFRYLASDDIHAFVGGSLHAIGRRLNLLFRKPNGYLARPHQQRQNAEANHRRLLYELDERGRHVLRDHGLPFLAKHYYRNFAHELMVCRIMASIELGTRAAPTVRMISWPEILANSATPEATRFASNPASIPVRFTENGQAVSIIVSADARPFGIERLHDSRHSYLFFPGIEADCGTEPIESSDIDRSSIVRKLTAYRAIAAQDLHRTHFGFPNFLVPITTTTERRMKSIMELLARMTGGRGSKMFLFTTFPAFHSFEKPPPASGHMLTRDWQRVGFAPFQLAAK